MPRPATCAGPGPCSRPARARGLCVGHLAQLDRGQGLRPLRDRAATPRVVVSVRVDAATKGRVLADPPGARAALEKWARS